MVILGILLIGLGIVAVLAAYFVSEGSAQLLGMDFTPFQIFIAGVVAGAFVLWGFSLLKFGTRRELAHRRERKDLNKLAEKLDRAETERTKDDKDTGTGTGTGTSTGTGS